MKRAYQIILLLLFIVISLLSFIYYRYNLSYGNTIFQKSMMIGCINKTLLTTNHGNSVKTCECLINNLTAKYTDEEIRNLEDISAETEIFEDCKKYFKRAQLNKEIKSSFEYFNFPDTIRKDDAIDTFSYYYKLSDTVINDPDDYRFMTVYTQFFKTKKEAENRLNLKERDTFYTDSENFNDTLRCPIFYKNIPESGRYYLQGEVKIQSLAAYYGKKDSTGGKMITREFIFYKPIVVE